MFCVLPVFDNGIDVLDWGYSSIEQLLDAWNDTKFENACMLTFFFREYSWINRIRPRQYLACVQKGFFNHEPHEQTWRGLIARNPHGLYTDGTRTLHGLYTDFTRTLHGLYTDSWSVGSAMLELALKGRDIPAQGNALGQGSHHRQRPVRARHNPCPKFLCAKAGFTFLVGGDMERRRLAGRAS